MLCVLLLELVSQAIFLTYRGLQFSLREGAIPASLKFQLLIDVDVTAMYQGPKLVLGRNCRRGKSELVASRVGSTRLVRQCFLHIHHDPCFVSMFSMYATQRGLFLPLSTRIFFPLQRVHIRVDRDQVSSIVGRTEA